MRNEKITPAARDASTHNCVVIIESVSLLKVDITHGGSFESDSWLKISSREISSEMCKNSLEAVVNTPLEIMRMNFWRKLKVDSQCIISKSFSRSERIYSFNGETHQIHPSAWDTNIYSTIRSKRIHAIRVKSRSTSCDSAGILFFDVEFHPKKLGRCPLKKFSSCDL